MKYFRIKDSLDEAVVGKDYPQAYKFTKDYDPDAPKALFSLYNYITTFPSYTPKLNGIMLAGSAKLTDFVSNGFSGNLFIISETAKQIFEQYQLCPHRFYPLGLYKRKIKYDYFMLNIVPVYYKYVDFKKSTFTEYDTSSRQRYNTVLIDSWKDLLQKRKKLKNKKGIEWGIWGDEIVMNSSFDEELDFFTIGRIDGYTYVSERLKESIESHGLTGWDFFPADHLIVEN